MPDQPPDPIHYDMKIPPEPKDHDEEERHSAKKHGDKIHTESQEVQADRSGEKKKPDSQSGS